MDVLIATHFLARPTASPLLVAIPHFGRDKSRPYSRIFEMIQYFSHQFVGNSYLLKNVQIISPVGRASIEPG